MSVREIGSDFHLSLAELRGRGQSGGWLPLEDPGSVFLSSGRDALCWIIQGLGLLPGSEVLLPAYLCSEVLAPFQAQSLKIKLYGITRELEVDVDDLLGKLGPQTRLVLFIHYFGFPQQLPQHLLEAMSPGTVLVEDATHALLSNLDGLPIRGHIRFASYRKLLPVLDGAVVSKNHAKVQDLDAPRLRRTIGRGVSVWARCAGGLLKSLWLAGPPLFPKLTFRKLFAWSEALLETSPKPAPMSTVSKYLLRSLDLEQVIAARRRNFQYLLGRFDYTDSLRPLYPSLPYGVCPLGFPILADDRDGLRGYLIEHRVYPPIHWELPESVDGHEFTEARIVSDHILTIPLDQRYNEEDMARIVGLINSYESDRALWPAGR